MLETEIGLLCEERIGLNWYSRILCVLQREIIKYFIRILGVCVGGVKSGSRLWVRAFFVSLFVL